MSRFGSHGLGGGLSGGLSGDYAPPALPPKDVHPRGEDYRALRSRARDLAELTNRRQPKPPGGTARALVQVYTDSTIPSGSDVVYLTHPVELDADDAEGATPTFAADGDQSIPVVVLVGSADAGDYLVAHAVGGRWFAEKVGVTVQFGCLWACGVRASFGSPSFGGTTATGVALTRGGQVVGIAYIQPGLNGSGYDAGSPPLVSIAPPPNPGTRATATVRARQDTSLGNPTITNHGSGYYDDLPYPAFAVTLSSSAGTWGPFTLDVPVFNAAGHCVWSHVEGIDVPGSGVCPGASGVPLSLVFDAFTRILTIQLGESLTSGFTCPPTTLFYSSTDGATCNESSPACGPNNPMGVYPNCNTVITCLCPAGQCPGGDIDGPSIAVGFPPCSGRPYSGSATVTILSTTSLDHGALFCLAGGSCGASSGCCSIVDGVLVCPTYPTLNITISEV